MPKFILIMIDIINIMDYMDYWTIYKLQNFQVVEVTRWSLAMFIKEIFDSILYGHTYFVWNIINGSLIWFKV